MGDPPDHQGGTPPNPVATTNKTGPKFLLMSRVYTGPEPKDLSLVSPFLIKKVIDGTCAGEIEMCKKLRDGKILLKTKNYSQALKLMNLKSLSPEIIINVTEHASLNTVRGVIYSNDLRNISEEVILDNLRSQHVVQVKKNLKKDINGLKETGLIIVTFEALTLPLHLIVGYERVNIRLYIPLPMKCINCCRYGHPVKYCKSTKMCANCGESSHVNISQNETCTNPKRCVNCITAGIQDCSHSSLDRKCPIFLREKEIQTIMTLEKVNKKTATSLQSQRSPTQNSTFAKIVSSNSPINKPDNNNTTPRPIADYSDILPSTSPSVMNSVKPTIKNVNILPRENSLKTKREMKRDW